MRGVYNRHSLKLREAPMGWVFFQVFLAFGMGVLIVWWTWPKSKKPDKAASSTEELAPSDKE